MVKLKDTAELCNISITQVSRALNNHDEISEDIRQKILKVANELGYVKNIFAINLVNISSNQIAIFKETYHDVLPSPTKHENRSRRETRMFKTSPKR